MTPCHALAEIVGYAKANRVFVREHAWKRMHERRVTLEDLLNALRNPMSCVPDEEDAELWKVVGPDMSGDGVTAIVAIEDGVIVITVYG